MHLRCLVDAQHALFDFEYPLIRFWVSQQGASVVAACGASPTSEKNAPLDLWSVSFISGVSLLPLPPSLTPVNCRSRSFLKLVVRPIPTIDGMMES
jgi:hypothetical protein